MVHVSLITWLTYNTWAHIVSVLNLLSSMEVYLLGLNQELIKQIQNRFKFYSFPDGSAWSI